MNQKKVGVIISYISIIFGLLVTLLYTPFMIRILGKSEYGIYNLAISFVGFLNILTFGLNVCYIRFFARYKNEQDEEALASFNTLYLLLFLIISFISLVCGAILITNLERIMGSKITSEEYKLVKILMSILTLNVAFSFAMNIFNSFITANENFVLVKLLQLFKVAFNPLLALPLLLLGYKSIGLVIVTCTINFLVIIISAIFSFKVLKIKFSTKKLDFSLIKEMYFFSFFIVIAILSNELNWNVGKLLIGKYLGSKAIAEYGLAIQLYIYVISITSILSSVLVPKINKLVYEKDYKYQLSNLLIRVGRIQYILVMAVILIFAFFGKNFVIIWAGREYINTYYIFTIIMIGSAPMFIQNIGPNILQALNMHKVRAVVILLSSLMNVLLSILLIQKIGIIGAAISASICIFMSQCLFINIYYKRVIGLDIKNFFIEIVKISRGIIIPIIACILLYHFNNGETAKSFLVNTSISSVIYIVSMYIFGLNKSERMLIFKNRSNKC